MVCMLVASWALGKLGDDEFRTIVTLMAGVIGFGAAFLAQGSFERRKLGEDEATTGRFVCRFREGRFIFSGPEKLRVFDTASIVGFTGDGRLSLVFVDGLTVRLPVRMAARTCAALAARLNDVLQELKSFSAGYRDAVPVVRVPTVYEDQAALEAELIDALQGRDRRQPSEPSGE